VILLVVYLLAYIMAGAPTIHSVEGWVVFGCVAVAAAIAGAIAESGAHVTVQLTDDDFDEGEDIGV
jgi:hypothetical protein